MPCKMRRCSSMLTDPRSTLTSVLLVCKDDSLSMAKSGFADGASVGSNSLEEESKAQCALFPCKPVLVFKYFSMPVGFSAGFSEEEGMIRGDEAAAVWQPELSA